MKKLIYVAGLLTFSGAVIAAQPPRAVIESCLLGRPSDSGVTVAMNVFGKPAKTLPVAYSVGPRSGKAFVAIETYRGYVGDAIALGEDPPPDSLEDSMSASYGVVKRKGVRFVCVTEANGQGSAAFVVSAFVGQFPPPKNLRYIRLYYVLADIRKLKTSRPG